MAIKVKQSEAHKELNETGVPRADKVAQQYQAMPEKVARDLAMLPVLMLTAFNTAFKNEQMQFREDTVRGLKASWAVNLVNRPKDEQDKLQTILPQDAVTILKSADADTGKEQVLMLTYAILQLADQERIYDVDAQALMASIVIHEEAKEFGDITPANEGRVVKGAERIIERATFMGYF